VPSGAGLGEIVGQCVAVGRTDRCVTADTPFCLVERLHLRRADTAAKRNLWRTNKPQLSSDFIFSVGLS
jgi:hypothetical protein